MLNLELVDSCWLLLNQRLLLSYYPDTRDRALDSNCPCRSLSHTLQTHSSLLIKKIINVINVQNKIIQFKTFVNTFNN